MSKFEIQCPSSKVSSVIGPKGSTIKQIQTSSGARVNVESTSDPAVISITGSPEQVEAAKALVEAIVSPPRAVLTCDKEHGLRLIGPGGSILKGICAESKASVKVNTDVEPATITIEASSQEAVSAAVALVKAITEPAGSVIIPCNGPAITHVVGPGGAKVKELMQTTGATITTTSDEVKIEGAPEQVESAAALIRKIIEEQANPDYAGPEGNRLRASAETHAQNRSRLMAEADECFKANDKDKGHALLVEAKEEGARMVEANKAAFAVILEHRNGGKGDLYLDLHGLHVDEALQATTERLDALKLGASADGVLELIPGAGHHSASGKAAIKPAVEEVLKSRGLKYEEKIGTFLVSVGP